jgi:hypothetical protein
MDKIHGDGIGMDKIGSDVISSKPPSSSFSSRLQQKFQQLSQKYNESALIEELNKITTVTVPHLGTIPQPVEVSKFAKLYSIKTGMAVNLPEFYTLLEKLQAEGKVELIKQGSGTRTRYFVKSKSISAPSVSMSLTDKSKSIMQKYAEAINRLGGKAEVRTYKLEALKKELLDFRVEVQPPDFKYVRFGNQQMTAGDETIYVPMIGTTGTYVTGEELKKYVEELNKAYEIVSQCGDVDSLVKETMQKVKIYIEEENKRKAQLAEEFAKLPREEIVWQSKTPEGDTINLVKTRSGGTFDPKKSSKVQGYVRYELRIPTKAIQRDLWTKDYITSDGRVMTARFVGHYQSLIGMENARKLAGMLKQLQEDLEKEKEKYQLW